MRARRLRKQAAELDITAFMNLIVVLVPFLLSTAVFTRLAVLELNVPVASSDVSALKDTFQLEVIIRRDAIEVSDQNGASLRRIANTATGHDFAELSTLMQQLKLRFPDKSDSTILSEPDTPYEVLVQVMDAVRSARVTDGRTSAQRELFSNISVGDAAPANKGGAALGQARRSP